MRNDEDAALQPERPLLNIEGERVALGPLLRHHLQLHLRWVNDFGTQRTAGDRVGPQTVEEIAAWYERRVVGPRDEAWFTVYETNTWGPIGFSGLRDIDYPSRSAEFGITIAPDCRGQGYGTEATRLTLDVAFTALGLANILLTVAEFSLRGQRAYARAGFRQIGRRTRVWPMGGRLWDEIFMECLADDFVSPVLGNVFVPDAPA